MQGGQEKVNEAGGTLAGGHSIADDSVKYGLSVTGVVHPDHILPNDGCREGDKLILTKPLGVGIIATANRVGETTREAMDEAIASMTTLNKYAAQIAAKYEVHGCTDVTGFGFLGHLHEMMHGEYSCRIISSQVPYIADARRCADEFLLTAAGQRNRNYVESRVDFGGIDFAMEEILLDPQTSGGLLISVAPEDAEALLAELKTLSLPCGMVGEVIRKQEKEIYILK